MKINVTILLQDIFFARDLESPLGFFFKAGERGKKRKTWATLKVTFFHYFLLFIHQKFKQWLNIQQILFSIVNKLNIMQKFQKYFELCQLWRQIIYYFLYRNQCQHFFA